MSYRGKFIQAKITFKYLAGSTLYDGGKDRQENKAKQDQGWNRTAGAEGRARAGNNKGMKLQENMKEQ